MGGQVDVCNIQDILDLGTIQLRTTNASLQPTHLFYLYFIDTVKHTIEGDIIYFCVLS